jgi:hypothetical protein
MGKGLSGGAAVCAVFASLRDRHRRRRFGLIGRPTATANLAVRRQAILASHHDENGKIIP